MKITKEKKNKKRNGRNDNEESSFFDSKNEIILQNTFRFLSKVHKLVKSISSLTKKYSPVKLRFVFTTCQVIKKASPRI